jgi:outer membrane protein assembly factor BamB
LLKTIVVFICLAALLSFSQPLSTPQAAASAPYDWLQFDGNSQHNGTNTDETLINSSNVAGLLRAFQVTLPSVADGAPVFLSNVSTPQGKKSLLFVTTRAGHIIALDARSGATLWSHQYPAGACLINASRGPCYTTSSPAIDPGRQFVYSYGLDGKVHKYQVGDGTEIINAAWPELVTTKDENEKGSSALSTATASNGTSYLYVTIAGYPGDQGDYQGHLTAINLTTGVQKVFNAVCSDQTVHFVQAPGSPNCAQVQTAIWARPGVVYDTATNRIYLATGNGTFDPVHHNWGESVFALNPDGTGANGNPLDSYTPANFVNLTNADADLGSTAPAIIPVPASSSVKHLAVQGGKDQLLRLLNLDNLSGQAGVGNVGGEVGGVTINVPQGGAVLTTPAVWTNPANGDTWVFVANNSGIAGLKLVINAGIPSLSPIWQKTPGGSSPLVANGVLYLFSSGMIRALDPLTGNPLWSSTQVGGLHWESPIVANGALFVTDESSNLTAFTIRGSAPGLIDTFYMPFISR